MLILLSALLSMLGSLTRCAGTGEPGSPAPDRGAETVCRKTAEADRGGPPVLGVSVPGLERMALGARHRPACHRDCLASQGISPLLDLENSAWASEAAGGCSRGPRSDPQTRLVAAHTGGVDTKTREPTAHGPRLRGRSGPERSCRRP